jgi:hypothetical protein
LLAVFARLGLASLFLLLRGVDKILQGPFWTGMIWAHGILYAFLGLSELAVILDFLWWQAMLGAILLLVTGAITMMGTPRLRQDLLAWMHSRTQILIWPRALMRYATAMPLLHALSYILWLGCPVECLRDTIRERLARYRLLVHPVIEMDYRQCSYVDEVAHVAMGYVLLRAWSSEEGFQPLELSSFFPVLLTAGFIGYISQLMLAIIEMQVRMWGTNMAAGLIEPLKAIAAEVDAANRAHQAGIAKLDAEGMSG